MNVEKLSIEEVVWEDHFSTDDWRSTDSDLDGTVLVTSVGYIVKETKTKIILTQNVNVETKHISNTMTILKKTVKSRLVIREPK